MVTRIRLAVTFQGQSHEYTFDLDQAEEYTDDDIETTFAEEFTAEVVSRREVI